MHENTQARYTISPVTLHIENSKFSALSISNNGEHRAAFQVEVKLWSQNEGTDVFQDTDDFIITPVIFFLEPGNTQQVRLGFRKEIALDIEQTYRLFLREILPQDKKKRSNEISMQFNFSIPIFIQPKEQYSPNLACTYKGIKKNNIEIKCTNSGNTYQFIKNLDIQEYGKPLQAIPIFKYVLGGHSIPIIPKATIPEHAQLSISTIREGETTFTNVRLKPE
ncbi:MAG: molecular chaperone [Proteobacteria bacterium]|nr:molecular chaperone [Pseudomonadota bacterium]